MLYQICEQCQDAYHEVIEDEYGANIADQIPLIGVGHSLGARLHVILNCINKEDEEYQNDLVDLAYERKGNILIGFNNYSSKRSIPLLNEMR